MNRTHSWQQDAEEIAARENAYDAADRLGREAEAEFAAGNTITSSYLFAVQGSLLDIAERGRENVSAAGPEWDDPEVRP